MKAVRTKHAQAVSPETTTHQSSMPGFMALVQYIASSPVCIVTDMHDDCSRSFISSGNCNTQCTPVIVGHYCAALSHSQAYQVACKVLGAAQKHKGMCFRADIAVLGPHWPLAREGSQIHPQSCYVRATMSVAGGPAVVFGASV